MPPTPLSPSRWDLDPDVWPDDDCVAIGADLEPGTVIGAYRTGAFPMPAGRRTTAWWSPVERGVLRLGDLRVTRSMRRARRRFAITVDESFSEVMLGCADPRRTGGWIDDSILEAYVRLHDLGWAHSIETRDAGGALVGGLYGLAIGGLFAGESMFHRATDASKVALMGLVELLDDEHAVDRLVDVQWRTDHLASLGVTTIPRVDYLARLSDVLAIPLPALWR